MPLTFASQYGIDNLNDVDLGIGRLDIAEFTNLAFIQVGAVEGTATANLNRMIHKVKAGSPMATVVAFAVDEEGTLKLEPIETSKVKNVDLLLGQPTSLYTSNASTSATSTNEAITAVVGSAVAWANDNWNTALTAKFSLTSGPGTALVLTTDYTIDAIHGTITLVAGGAGGASGVNVTVYGTYYYFLPSKVLTFGGYGSVRNFRLYWNHLRPQDNLWEVLEVYKAVPSLNWVKSYIQNAHNKYEMMWDFLADITRGQGDRIAQYRIQTQQPF